MRPDDEVRLSKYIIVLCIAAIIAMLIIGISWREVWLLAAILLLMAGMALNIRRVKKRLD
jgi:uncharacterized membrane protein YccC